MANNVSAVRDIVVVAAVGVAAYFVYRKLQDLPDVPDFGKILDDFLKNNELSKAWHAGMQGTTQTEVSEDLKKTWKERFGVSPDFPITNIGESGVSASIAPLPSTPTPVITKIPQPVKDMIFAPAPDRPDIKILPAASTTTTFKIQPMPVSADYFTTTAAALGQSIQPCVAAPAPSSSGGGGVSSRSAPAPAPAPYVVKPWTEVKWTKTYV